MFVVYGFLAVFANGVPEEVNMTGPFNTIQQCYAQLALRVTQMDEIQNARKWRGECEPFAKHGRVLAPDPNAQWMTAADLAARGQ